MCGIYVGFSVSNALTLALTWVVCSVFTLFFWQLESIAPG